MNMRIASLCIRALTLAVRFSLIFVLALYFEPSQVGLYGLVVATVGYSLYFVGFDFYIFSTRDLLGRSREQWPGLLTSQGALFLGLYCLVLPWSFFLFYSNLLPWWMMAWVIGLIIVEHLGQEIMRLAIAMGRPVLGTFLLFVRQGIWALAFMFAIWLEPGFRNLHDLLLFWIIGSACSVLLGSTILLQFRWRGLVKGVDWHWIRAGLRVAFPMLVATLALRAIFTLDRYWFGFVNSSELLGVYTLFIGIAGAVLAFMDAGVFAFLYPKMIERFKKGDSAGFKALKASLTRQTLGWLAVLMVAGGVMGPAVFSLMPNPLYFEHWPLFWGCLLAMGVFVAGMVPHYSLYSMSLDKPIILSNMLGLLVFVAGGALCSVFTTYWAVPVAMCAAALAMGISKQLVLVFRGSEYFSQSV